MGNILVIDDDPLNRRLLTATLERQGHQTSSAEDGKTALAMLAEDRPDVVLLDLVMPGMDGMEVLERIKGDDAAPPPAGDRDQRRRRRRERRPMHRDGCRGLPAQAVRPGDPARAGERGPEPQAAARPRAGTGAERVRAVRARVGRRCAARPDRRRAARSRPSRWRGPCSSETSAGSRRSRSPFPSTR